MKGKHHNYTVHEAHLHLITLHAFAMMHSLNGISIPSIRAVEVRITLQTYTDNCEPFITLCFHSLLVIGALKAGKTG